MTAEREKLLDVQDLTVQFGPPSAAPSPRWTRCPSTSTGGRPSVWWGSPAPARPPSAGPSSASTPTAGGKVIFDGRQINGKIPRDLDREVTRRIQMIFQDPMASLNERAKVDYIISEGLYGNGFHLSKEEREERVAQALTDVGLLPEFASRFPHEFSGGQRQRIGIARALIMEPDSSSPTSPSPPWTCPSGRRSSTCWPASSGPGADLPLHRPRPVGGPLPLRPHRRDPQGTDRGAGGERGALRPPPPHSEIARSPSQTPSLSGRRSCWSTTPAATTTVRATSPSGGRPAPATSCWPARGAGGVPEVINHKRSDSLAISQASVPRRPGGAAQRQRHRPGGAAAPGRRRRAVPGPGAGDLPLLPLREPPRLSGRR